MPKCLSKEQSGLCQWSHWLNGIMLASHQYSLGLIPGISIPVFSPMQDHRTAPVAVGVIFENCVIWDAYLVLFWKYSFTKQTACTSL